MTPGRGFTWPYDGCRGNLSQNWDARSKPVALSEPRFLCRLSHIYAVLFFENVSEKLGPPKEHKVKFKEAAAAALWL